MLENLHLAPCDSLVEIHSIQNHTEIYRSMQMMFPKILDGDSTADELKHFS